MGLRMFRIALIVAAFLTVRIVRGADNELTAAEKALGWVLLFDGKSLQGWENANAKPMNSAAIQDGVFNPHLSGSYVPYFAKQKFGNFTLALDFKLTKGC